MTAEPAVDSIDPSHVPHHVAIIMDGNGRWATQRGLPRAAGHKAGVNSLVTCVRAASDIGIKVLTVYAFSTENWQRPHEEVSFLMRLLEEALARELGNLHRNNVRVRVLGRRSNLAESTLRCINRAETLTCHNTGLQLNMGFNYGGRSELVDACRAISRLVAQGEIAPEEIDESLVAAHLSTADVPDPDLIIRTGGDLRISNFLLWQIAYAELYVTSEYWPDFRQEHLQRAIADFQRRKRRFGKV